MKSAIREAVLVAALALVVFSPALLLAQVASR